MSHLTEEQFESILQGHTHPSNHLGKCEVCSNKLAEKRAIAARLRSTFSNIQASDELAEQIKKRLSAQDRRLISLPKVHRTRVLFPQWRYWAAVAAVLIAVPFIVMLSAPSQVVAVLRPSEDQRG